MLYHKLIPKLHTTAKIVGRENDLIVSGIADALPGVSVCILPVRGLVRTGKSQVQANLRMALVPKCDNSFGSQCIKTKRATTDKPTEAGIPAILDCPAKQAAHTGPFRLRQISMATETDRILFSA